jgi:hypothetical protein
VSEKLKGYLKVKEMTIDLPKAQHICQQEVIRMDEIELFFQSQWRRPATF